MAVGFAKDDDVSNTVETNVLNEIDRARSELRGVGSSHCINPDCGAEIPLMRRVAMPNARYCIRCQAEHDGTPSVGYNRRGSKDSQLR